MEGVMASGGRKLAMSRTGRWLLVTDGDERKLLDLAGTMPQRVVELAPGAIAGFVGRELWTISAEGLSRIAPGNLRPLSPTLRLPGVVTQIIAAGGPSIAEGVLIGTPTLRVGLRGDAVVIEVVNDVTPEERVVAALGGRLYLAGGDGMRALERGRELWHLPKTGGAVMGAVSLFGGRAIALLLRRDADDAIAVVQAHGARIHVLEVPRVVHWAVAEELGHAFVFGVDGKVRRLDLRYGREIAAGAPVVPIVEIHVDEHGRQMVLLTPERADVIHIQASELFQAKPSTTDRDDTDGANGANGEADAHEESAHEAREPASVPRAASRPAGCPRCAVATGGERCGAPSGRDPDLLPLAWTGTAAGHAAAPRRVAA
ncbi:MAG: hypothetical protein WKG01_01930 [Kofleriaceae bacterium]